jgi:hypothetical protein
MLLGKRGMHLLRPYVLVLLPPTLPSRPPPPYQGSPTSFGETRKRRTLRGTGFLGLTI